MGPPVIIDHLSQWADVGFAEALGKLSRGFYRRLRQRVRHGLSNHPRHWTGVPRMSHFHNPE